MKIKVCGLKFPENIEEVAALLPDYMGFICYSKSPRYIDKLDEDLLATLPEHILKTGVFVNQSTETINKYLNRYEFDVIQLHGNESPELCKMFRKKVLVIKAFGVDEHFDFNRLDAYKNHVDYFLFDTKTPVHGGSGVTFNWEILNNYTGEVPFFLSGGLSLDNLAEAAKFKHPQLYGADLNSRFEVLPGLKDLEKLKKAFNTIKTFNSDEVRS
jgi:phosphoribosylanthranilate isomerase